MTGLDLRIWPPRGPRERLDGLLFMPRSIDKIRATLPGGNLGPYHIGPGLTTMLLGSISVDLDDLREAVRHANSDHGLAQWLRSHANLSQYAHANTLLSEYRQEQIPPDHREHFESLYPEYLRARYPLLFDLIEADDRELYPALHKA